MKATKLTAEQKIIGAMNMAAILKYANTGMSEFQSELMLSYLQYIVSKYEPKHGTKIQALKFLFLIDEYRNKLVMTIDADSFDKKQLPYIIEIAEAEDMHELFNVIRPKILKEVGFTKEIADRFGDRVDEVFGSMKVFFADEKNFENLSSSEVFKVFESKMGEF